MNQANLANWIAFAQSECIASGTPQEVAAELKKFTDANPETAVSLFDANSSHPVEIDLRGDLPTIFARLPVMPASVTPSDIAQQTPSVRPPGRPRLGVTAREVTLLPRHWEWLGQQSGGASVALRKLVEQAIRTHHEAGRIRAMQESAYRFMMAVAGNESGYEEATRALFSGDVKRLAELVSDWPLDVQAHLFRLVSEMAA